MTNAAVREFQYPSTRYSGSKRRLLDWIWECVKDLRFDSVLDAFGGTASVTLMFKRHGKTAHYNDVLKFNQIVGTAVIENSDITVSEKDISAVLEFSRDSYPDFIQKEFRGVFFLDEENAWLDRVVTNVAEVEDKYKRSLLLSSIFQACLAKRPFNLFHRANLYLRMAQVERTFGNKATWDKPFEELFRRNAAEYNRAVFSNGKDNRVIGGFDALLAPNGVDLVYLDPPYFPAGASQGTNYLAFYHFLEGLADYEHWSCASSPGNSLRKISDSKEIKHFTKKSEIVTSFRKLLERFRDNIIVLSYQSDGIPSRDEILTMLAELGKRTEVFERAHRYVLSPKVKTELLFVAG